MKNKMIKSLVAVAVSTSAILGCSSIVASASEMTVATGITTASSLNVRSDANTNSNVKGSLPRNSKVEIVRLQGSWDKIKFKGGTGYVYNEYISNVHKISNNTNNQKIAYNATVTASALNMRSGPSTGYGVKLTLEHNTEVGVISSSNGWAQISHKGNIGYVSSSYLKKVSDSSQQKPVEKIKIAYTTASYLNMRTSPTTSWDNVIMSIPRNTKIEVQSVSNGWAKINANGRIGYVSADYIKYSDESSSSTPVKEDWVNKLNVSRTTNQLITVQADGSYATVQFHKKNSNGNWSQEFSTKGRLGYNGLISNRHEGDGTTPVGVYTLGIAFGTHSNPGCSHTYYHIDNEDWWCADENSPEFNTFQHWNDGVTWSTKGGEHMADYPTQYEYGISLNYNTGNATPEKGSAIFLHCSGAGSTAGCVSIPKDKMLQILKEVSPSAKIVISTTDGIYNY